MSEAQLDDLTYIPDRMFIITLTIIKASAHIVRSLVTVRIQTDCLSEIGYRLIEISLQRICRGPMAISLGCVGFKADHFIGVTNHRIVFFRLKVKIGSGTISAVVSRLSLQQSIEHRNCPVILLLAIISLGQ